MVAGVPMKQFVPQMPRLHSWSLQALCHGYDPDMFFPKSDRGENPRVYWTQSRDAVSICNRCPVIAECLEEALSMPRNHDWGVWGGTTPQERDQLRKTMTG